ncbi:hypothetical protein BBR47_07260 [Brevibacillus brevis NBRC 100599]|uniref:Uncharacterized protein n=1 Tax=Brevibacillus brevis (strain 47 / JCM 6285 / NBRC 100599) TaxID=358681 RepID=C0Z4H6_BREBN|nr:hypothetical protein BBR47_07260 [Brevibacillus brevis NBRC 100599]
MNYPARNFKKGTIVVGLTKCQNKKHPDYYFHQGTKGTYFSVKGICQYVI